MEITNKMRFHGEKIDDVAIVEKILRSLTPKYNYVVCSIEESKYIDALSLDELQSSLLVHEQKMNKDSTEGVEVEAEQEKEEIVEDSSTEISKATLINFKAKAVETMTNPRLPNDKEKEESANFVENKEVETLLMAVQGGIKHESDIWYIDIGLMGKCDIKIKIKNGFVETISNVLYVPDLKSNLLSAGQLQEKDYVITIKKGEREIYDPVRGAIAVVQISSNRLFSLKIDDIQSCLMAEVKDSSWLWHFRYGHLSFRGLKTLHQKNMVTWLPQITAPSKICEKCVLTQVLYDSDVELEKFSAACTSKNSTTSATVAVENKETTRPVGHIRRRPAWMEDYMVTEIEDPITHFALFLDCDPTSFESAVKEEK
ncbi:uncharacterized protein LOC129875636 [Solanum dulcamara]|uniref:uncharacterized protein LOC129875636 n=1 Tax=Solanum dulcamara TaxID=45834 RepID=UPI0024867A87|nr:uncharacterized protein LOC129875636 [Solanum dulcamara]